MSAYILPVLCALVVVLLIALVLVTRVCAKALDRNAYLEGLREVDREEIVYLRRRAWSFIYFLRALDGMVNEKQCHEIECRFKQVLQGESLISVFQVPPRRHERSPWVADHYEKLLDEAINAEYNVAA